MITPNHFIRLTKTGDSRSVAIRVDKIDSVEDTGRGCSILSGRQEFHVNEKMAEVFTKMTDALRPQRPDPVPDPITRS